MESRQENKGSKTTPAEDRKANVQMLFSGKVNAVKDVINASEKNLGIKSSKNDNNSDSESSSDFGDFFMEVQGDSEKMIDFNNLKETI